MLDYQGQGQGQDQDMSDDPFEEHSDYGSDVSPETLKLPLKTTNDAAEGVPIAADKASAATDKLVDEIGKLRGKVESALEKAEDDTATQAAGSAMEHVE